MFGNSEKNITTFVTSWVIPSSAAVLSPNAHSRIASTVLIIAFQILLGSCCRNVTTPLKAASIFATIFARNSITFAKESGSVWVKNFTIAVTTTSIAFFIFPHTFAIAALASSFVAIKVTIAATSPATSVTIKIIGLAFIAAFIAHCAIVAPSFASLNAWNADTTPWISEATLNAANPAPIPANTLTIASPLSAIHPKPSSNAGSTAATISPAFSIKFPKPVAIFSNAPLKLPSVKSVCSCPITSVIFSTAFVSGVLNFS